MQTVKEGEERGKETSSIVGQYAVGRMYWNALYFRHTQLRAHTESYLLFLCTFFDIAVLSLDILHDDFKIACSIYEYYNILYITEDLILKSFLIHI